MRVVANGPIEIELPVVWKGPLNVLQPAEPDTTTIRSERGRWLRSSLNRNHGLTAVVVRQQLPLGANQLRFGHRTEKHAPAQRKAKLQVAATYREGGG